MPETSFHEQLQSHVGSLVRLKIDVDALSDSIDSIHRSEGGRWNDRIGLLLRSCASGAVFNAAWIVLLVDGRHKSFLVLPGEIELIPAEGGE